MNKLKFILPLILATITLVTYRPIEAQASTTQYNINWSPGYVSPNGDIITGGNATNMNYSNLIEIINNSIIFNYPNYIHSISYYNNGTFIQFNTNNNNTPYNTFWGTNHIDFSNINIPNNTTHFRINVNRTFTSSDSNSPQLTTEQLDSLIVSYTTPAPALPSENPTTFPNITFIDNQSINVVTGMPESNNNFMRTDLIDIGSKSNLPANFVFAGEERLNTLGLFYPTITLYYDSNMELINYSGREIRTASSGGNLIGTRLFPSNLISNDDVGIVPNDTKYIAYVVIKDSTADRTTSGGEVINPIGTANFTDWQEYEFVTNLRLVRWGVQTPISQGGGIIFFFSAFLEVGTNLEPFTESLLTDPNVAREGFIAVGFDGATTVPSASGNVDKLVIYEQLITYTVTFLDYDGTFLGTDTVQDGFPANPPLIPTRTGYTFTSWLPPIASITGDITTTAQYTPNLYQITWISDGVIVKQTNEPYDSQILDIIPFVTKENHTLVGWIYSFDSSPVVSGLVQFAFTAEAVWQEVPTFTVTWRDPSFNTLKIEYVIESGLATPPSYNPGSGLILVGWTPDPTQPITQNTTFIAVVQTAPTPPPPTTPESYSPIADLFGGVIGASIGAIMTLGTIELYGITLNSLIFLFVSMSLGLWILKAIRG